MKETGVGLRDPLFFIGVVENNVDERLEGRVQVRAFGVHGTNKQVPTESLPWATLIHGSYDPNAPLPKINSFVFGFFVDGRDAQQPMILGLIPTQMTEEMNPETQGWGAIPNQNAQQLSQGSNPEDFGQPQNSKLARAEYIEDTYVLQQEMNRIKDVDVANGLDEERQKFEEPAPAYAAEYPFNRVMETNSHVMEFDDTPGAERIMLYHKRNGSYVSIDSTGTTVQKSTNDKYEINDVHQHVYVGGKSHVTILGDSRVYVKGNKVEEIEGNYTQIIHGNHITSIGGQVNINGSEEVQIRAGKLRLEGNVEGVNIKAAKKIRLMGGETINIKSEKEIRLEAAESIGVKSEKELRVETAENIGIKTAKEFRLEAAEGIGAKSGKELRLESAEMMSIKSAMEMRLTADENVGIKSGIAIAMSADGAIDINAQSGNLNMQTSDDLNILSSKSYLEAGGAFDIKGGHVKLGGGTKVSIDAQIVAIDDIVQLASGQATTPEGAGSAGEAEPADPAIPADVSEDPDAEWIGPPEPPEEAEVVEMPEPPAKSASVSGHRNSGSTGSSGHIGADESGSPNRPPDSTTSNSEAVENYSGKRLTNAKVDEILSGEEPAQARTAAEDFLGRSMSDDEWDNLVAATVAESLPNSPQEQAAIMSVILNRVRDPRFPNTVNGVLLQPNQFQAVTGTSANGRAPSRNFTNPDRRQMASTISGVSQYMGTMDQGWLNFTSNITAAYGAGTNIGFRDQVRNSPGSRVIGGTVFGSVS